MESTGKLAASLGKEWLFCQEKSIFLGRKQKKLMLGIPNETAKGENRICLTPESVELLVAAGHDILLQRGAGNNARYSDAEYCDAGAQIVETTEEAYRADILLKVTSVTSKDVEYMHEKQVVLSALKLCDLKKEAITGMMHKNVTALGFDIIKDCEGYYPVVRIMSELAGNAAIMIAAEYLSNSGEGKGVLLGGFSGITPCEVVILGAGTLGEYAARSAIGLGANVKVFDHSVNRLRNLTERLGQRVYTSVFHRPVLEKALKTADVIVGALRCFESGNHPVITEEQVRMMKKGTIIIDMSIDHGGCIETSVPTTHERPVYSYEGVIHYCVPNVLSRVSRTASIAFSNVFLPLLQNVSALGGFPGAIRCDAGLRNGVYIYNGILTKEVIADKFGLISRDIDLLMATF